MYKTSPVTQMAKNLPAMRKTQVWSLGGKDPLEKGMATHSSSLAWRIPWTEEPGGLQSVGPQRVGIQLKQLSTHTHSGLSQNWALGMHQQTRRTRSCFHGAYFLMGWEDNLFINEWANTHTYTHNKENINTRQRIKSGWCANRGLRKPLWKSHTYMVHEKCIHRSKKQVMQRFRVEQPWGTERKLLRQSLVGVERGKGRVCMRERRQEVKAWDFIY